MDKKEMYKEIKIKSSMSFIIKDGDKEIKKEIKKG